MVVIRKSVSQPARTNAAYQDFDDYVFKYMQRERRRAEIGRRS